MVFDIPQSTSLKKCRFCGKDFLPKRTWQIYCHNKCRWNWWAKGHPRYNVDIVSIIDKKIRALKKLKEKLEKA